MAVELLDGEPDGSRKEAVMRMPAAVGAYLLIRGLTSREARDGGGS
jgi:hypothetical protein